MSSQRVRQIHPHGIALFVLLALCIQFAAAQEPVAPAQAPAPLSQAPTGLALRPFVGHGLSDGELDIFFRIVNDYASSYASAQTGEQTRFYLVSASQEQSEASMYLDGLIDARSGLYVLGLSLSFSDTSQKLSVSASFSSVNDAILSTRALCTRLFALLETWQSSATPEAAPSAATAISSQSAPELSMLVGSWKGDKGLGTVRIFPDGSAVAVLLYGGIVRLRVTVSGSEIYIEQAEANKAALYRSEAVSQAQAERIVAMARPMRWIFTLSADGSTLFGLKESLAVSGSTSDIQVDNQFTRPALWSRVSR
ncbi:MAG TPA: hypothetical protein PLC54_03845 [Spirochaetales bacterium]|nr:hypothetical protein [Spirochaetales bacterium]